MNKVPFVIENWNKSLSEERKSHLVNLYNNALQEDGQTQNSVKESEWDEMFTKDVLDYHIFVLRSVSDEGHKEEDLFNVKGFSLLIKYKGTEKNAMNDFWLMQMLAVDTKSQGQGFGKVLLKEVLNGVYQSENKKKTNVDGGPLKGLMLKVGDVFGGSLLLHAYVKKGAYKTQKFYKSNGAKLISQSVLVDEYGEQVHPLNWNVNRWKWQQENQSLMMSGVIGEKEKEVAVEKNKSALGM